MKILHALYSDRKGGLEQAFVNVTRMLLSLGHDVELWVPEKAPYLGELEKVCTRVELRSHGYLDFFALMRHRKNVKKSAPDLIISHNSRATSLLVNASAGYKIPHLAFSHGYKTHRFKKVDHVVVLTEDMKKHFMSAGYIDKIVSIFPNVIERVPDITSRKVPVQGQPIRLGYVGRLNEEKGLEDLLHALALITNSQRLELHIAGSGPDQVLIEDLARKLEITSSLHFSGWVDDIQSWMNSINLIVVPSRSESFGIVVLEAAAYGCPVIATNVAGPASQVTHKVDGWLAKPCSPKSLAKVIEYVLQRPESWEAVRQAAYQRAKHYQMDARLKELDAIIHHVTA